MKSYGGKGVIICTNGIGYITKMADTPICIRTSVVRTRLFRNLFLDPKKNPRDADIIIFGIIKGDFAFLY